MVNKRHAGRKRTVSVDKEIRSDQRERNQEFQDKQDGLEDIHISPPEHLDHIGKHLWRTLVPELKKVGTIKQIDHVNLESFCSAYSSYRLAEEDIKENSSFNADQSISFFVKHPNLKTVSTY